VSSLHEEFHECPLDADDATMTLYTRAWMWHMFTTVLFPDGMGDVASWMYIPALADWDVVGCYSWGLAVLAYLYHHLCEAYQRRG
jgi:hypothetical protein